ncbi:MAG: hypothetical protein QXU21_04395 [Candidatus Bathyarchaeia archaeon]
MSEAETLGIRRKLVLKIAKATVITALTGGVLLILWFFTSIFGKSFPHYSTFFAIFAWAMLFFTFATTLSEGTIYKYILLGIRTFFLIIYIAYATNYGLLSINFEGFTLTIEFIPLLALMIFANLLELAREVLQAIEFSSQSSKD